jgi:hypothetical protein
MSSPENRQASDSQNDDTLGQVKHITEQINIFYNSLNKNIGLYWWKKYITTAFWKNISTPINLSITILTALTTGQIATHGLFSDNTTTKLSVSTLLLSIINTFFRPNTQYSTNLEEMKKWADYGIEFEEISIKPAINETKLKDKLNLYKSLFKKVNQLKRADTSNYFTDLIYIIATYTCLKEENWLKDEEKMDDEANIYINLDNVVQDEQVNVQQ